MAKARGPGSEGVDGRGDGRLDWGAEVTREGKGTRRKDRGAGDRLHLHPKTRSQGWQETDRNWITKKAQLIRNSTAITSIGSQCTKALANKYLANTTQLKSEMHKVLFIFNRPISQSASQPASQSVSQSVIQLTNNSQSVLSD